MKTKDTRVFVDAVVGPTARLLLGDKAFDVPATLLPGGAREGSWVRLRVGVVPAPDDGTEALRAKLGQGDPGGTIKL